MNSTQGYAVICAGIKKRVCDLRHWERIDRDRKGAICDADAARYFHEVGCGVSRREGCYRTS